MTNNNRKIIYIIIYIMNTRRIKIINKKNNKSIRNKSNISKDPIQKWNSIIYSADMNMKEKTSLNLKRLSLRKKALYSSASLFDNEQYGGKCKYSRV